MLSITITGSLPAMQKNSIPDAMEAVADLMQRSITMNFLMGGRPNAWTPLRNGGETPLVRTGQMMRTVSSNFGETFAEAGMLSDFPAWYWAHQVGTSTAGRNHNVRIPARPFVLFQEQDRKAILETVTSFIEKSIKTTPI